MLPPMHQILMETLMQLKNSSALWTRIAKIGLPLLLSASALTAPAAWAAGSWNTQPETLATHPTWIYTPAGTMEPSATAKGDKRALLVVLHGCDQTHTQLKEWGNLAAAAEAKGAVIAVPWVGDKPWPLFASTKCWNYDGATDGSGHVANLVALTKTLVDRQGLNIDPRHVYIGGMSSGASVAMLAACKAPALIAGVSAVAGPSVGSSQMNAISDNPTNPTPAAAAAKCKSLAGTANLAHFNTQIANVGYGEMDRNAERPGCSYSSGDTRCPGTYLLVSKGWSTINAEMYRLVYGAGTLGTAVKVNNNAEAAPEYMGEHREAKVGDDEAASLTRIYNVGHAWPAGSGQENSAAKGGVWMAQKGMNYGQYMLSWLIANNRRPYTDDNLAPVVEWCKAEPAGENGVTISAKGHDKDGTIVSYKVVLKRSGTDVHIDTAAGSGNSFSKTYSPLANGPYTAVVTATDNEAKPSYPPCEQNFRVGPIVLDPPSDMKATGKTTTSVTLNWTNVGDASQYVVTAKKAGQPQVVATKTVPEAAGASTSVIVDGLEKATAYDFTVRSKNGGEESPESAVVPATTDSWICTLHYTSNYTHVSQGRAYHSLGYAKAKGSNQNMGLYTLFHYTSLAQVKEGHYVIGICPK